VSRDIDAFVLTAVGGGLALGVLLLPVLSILMPVIDAVMVWFGALCVAVALTSVIVWVCNPKRG